MIRGIVHAFRRERKTSDNVFVSERDKTEAEDTRDGKVIGYVRERNKTEINQHSRKMLT